MCRVLTIAAFCTIGLALPCQAQRGMGAAGGGRAGFGGVPGFYGGARVVARGQGAARGGLPSPGLRSPFASAGLVVPGGRFRRLPRAHGAVVFVPFSPFFDGIFDPFLFFNPFASPRFFNPFFQRPFFNPFFLPKPFFPCGNFVGGFGAFGIAPFACSPGFVPFATGVVPWSVDASESGSNGEQSPQATTSDREDQPRWSQAEENQLDQPEQPQEELPPTVLMFRDRSWIEVRTYTIIFDYLYEYDPHWIRKIRLSDLDIPETIRFNAERGIQFRVPAQVQRGVIRP